MPSPLRYGVVIGATSGVGQALVARLAPHARVVAAARRSHPPAPNVEPVSCDVRTYADVEALFRRLERTPDFVVNASGVGFYAPLDGDYSAEWEQILATNVLGLVHVMSSVLRAHPHTGHFVQLGSMAARRLSRTVGNAVYSASKAAALPLLEHFRSVLRAEGSLTRVTLMTPGFIAGTDFGKNFFRAQPDAAVDIFADAPSLTADDVAGAIVDVLSSDVAGELSEIVLRPRQQPD